MNADAYRPLIVTYRNGSPVRLGKIATVVDSVQDTGELSAWYNNQRAIMFQIQRQPGTNTVQVVDRIKSLMPEFRGVLPPAIEMNTVYDRSESIRESVNDVKLSLELAIVLVVLVIFLSFMPGCLSAHHSRPQRCLFRWWAHSPQWRCWATRSITSR